MVVDRLMQVLLLAFVVKNKDYSLSEICYLGIVHRNFFVLSIFNLVLRDLRLTHMVSLSFSDKVSLVYLYNACSWDRALNCV